MKKLLLIAVVLFGSSFASAGCVKCVWIPASHAYLCQLNLCGGDCSCDATLGYACTQCGSCVLGHCIFPCFGPVSATEKTALAKTATAAQASVWGEETVAEVRQLSKGAAHILFIERDSIMKSKPMAFHDSRGAARVPGDPDIDNNWVEWTKQYDATTGSRIFTITHQLKEDAVGPNLLVIEGEAWHLYSAPDGIYHERPEHAITEVGSGVIKRDARQLK